MAKTFRDKLQESFFENADVSVFSENEYKHAVRLRGIFTYQLEFPYLAKTKLVEWITSTFEIEKSQAYADASLVESLLGNVRNARKEWIKYVATQTVLEAIEIAKSKQDSKAMTKGAEVLAMIHGLDKIDDVDANAINLNINFEPTDDIRSLSPHLRTSTQQDRDRLRAKLLSDTGFEQKEQTTNNGTSEQ